MWGVWMAVGLAVACVGGLLFLRLKIPAGAMIGAMLFVGILNIICGDAVYFPPMLKALTQMIAGAFIGQSVSRDSLRSIMGVGGAAVFLAVSMLCAGVGFGYALHAISGFDLVTCLFAAAPGGLTDISLLAVDAGADVSKVGVLHLFRLISVSVLCPQINRLFIRKMTGDGAKTLAWEKDSAGGAPAVSSAPDRRNSGRVQLRTAAIGVGAGLVGYWSGIPAGSLIFAMIAVAAYNIKESNAHLSIPVRRGTQMAAGAIVGQSFGMEQVLALGGIIIPALILVLSFLAFSLLLAFLLYKLFRIDLSTALFASVPAGMSDMALIAVDIGGNSPQVAILQVARVVSILSVYPQIVGFLGA